MSDFLAALGLAIVLEGLLYAAFPEQMKRFVQQLSTLSATRIRAVALTCAAVGLGLLWAVRG